MLNIENSLINKYPRFASKSPMIRNPTVGLLRKITYERRINQFLHDNSECQGVEFIERIFEYFNFSYSVTSRDRRNIPAQGRIIIIANHPIGSLDGLALLHLVSEVRPDVRIVANDVLLAFEQLHSLLLPLDNMTRRAYKESYSAILQALNNEEAVIIFPAGEVSRVGPTGVRDGAWQAGFLRFARKAQAPLLPVHIAAKNSFLFYSMSTLFKPLATALLVHEMFKKQSAEIRFRIGEVIPYRTLNTDKLSDKSLIHRLKKQVYRVGKNRKAIFVVEKTIAHPEDRGTLIKELATAPRLGQTRDKHSIYLCEYDQHPVMMREIGRLREQAFRRVGEGTGRHRDLDHFDHFYQHLVLWDETALAVAGAYRIGHTGTILKEKGIAGIYSAELFSYQEPALAYLENAVELGRSFVNPSYWGRNSLDYLWQGLGAYLRSRPEVRYLIGPVSMSADYPKHLQDLLVCFFARYYLSPLSLATPRHSFHVDARMRMQHSRSFSHLDRVQAFDLLQTAFSEAGHKVPTLFKHYAAVFEDQGYQLLAFNVDAAFGNCIDGLFLGDLSLMKASKRRRYIGDQASGSRPEPLSADAMIDC